MLARLDDRLALTRLRLTVAVPAGDAAAVAWLHRHAEILSERYDDEGTAIIELRIDLARGDEIRQRFTLTGPG